VPIKETMRAMEKLVDDGTIRYIGLSNFSLSQDRGRGSALEA
jgi:diketogulonate reductase-like aldo/keto reductase